jgi:hypothetical protein
MPLLKYFGWVGGSLVAALFAANWCFSVPIARSRPSDVPLNQRINIRTHTDHKWPERVVIDPTPSVPTREAKLEAKSNLGSSETLAQAERQPFDAFAEMTIPVRPCFRPPCSAGEAAERQTSPLVKKRAISKTHACARASLPPIGFTSRQEEADPLAHESGQFAAQVFRALSHQSPHQHWEQDEIHENLRGCEASFRAEGAF